MSIEGDFCSWQTLAGEDLSANGALHKAVSGDGKIAQSIVQFLGVLKSKAASGEMARVAIDGVVKVVAGAAVSTIGNPVTVTTSGFIVAGTSTIPYIGRALAIAASGDLFPIALGAS